MAVAGVPGPEDANVTLRVYAHLRDRRRSNEAVRDALACQSDPLLVGCGMQSAIGREDKRPRWLESSLACGRNPARASSDDLLSA